MATAVIARIKRYLEKERPSFAMQPRKVCNQLCPWFVHADTVPACVKLSYVCICDAKGQPEDDVAMLEHVRYEAV
jgi:hypothetical protein